MHLGLCCLKLSLKHKYIYNLRAGNQQLLYGCIRVLCSDALAYKRLQYKKSNTFTLTCCVLQILNRKESMTSLVYNYVTVRANKAERMNAQQDGHLPTDSFQWNDLLLQHVCWYYSRARILYTDACIKWLTRCLKVNVGWIELYQKLIRCVRTSV